MGKTSKPKISDLSIPELEAELLELQPRIEELCVQRKEFIAQLDDPKVKNKKQIRQQNKDAFEEKMKLEDRVRSIERKLKSLKTAEEKKAYDEAKADVTGTTFSFHTKEGEISKKAAYIKYNRQIEEPSVKYWMEVISSGHYEADCPMFVADAEIVRRNQPAVEIVDAEGNAIPDEEIGNYYVMLDGQHRSRAYMILILLNRYDGSIPGVIVKNDIQDYAQYLRSLNGERSWTNKQKGQIIALTAPEKYKELCVAINNLVQEGFSPSTASQIYTFDNHITSSQINDLLAGKEPVPTMYPNIERGNRFIEACKKAGIDVKYMKKRYFVEGFVKATKAKNEEQAWRALDNLQMTTEQLKNIKCTDDFTKILVKQIEKEGEVE